MATCLTILRMCAGAARRDTRARLAAHAAKLRGAFPRRPGSAWLPVFKRVFYGIYGTARYSCYELLYSYNVKYIALSQFRTNGDYLEKSFFLDRLRHTPSNGCGEGVKLHHI